MSNLEGKLLPRYAMSDVISHLCGFHGLSSEELAAMPPTTLVDARWAAASLPRAELDDLLLLRRRLTDWAADEFGFPSPFSSSQARWDVELGVQLNESLDGVPEAHHPATFAWLAAVLLPHLVHQRWGWPKLMDDGAIPSTARPWSRYGTGLRNGLRLAAYRVGFLGEHVASVGNEQEFQDVLERPAFGNDPRVATLIISRLAELSGDDGGYMGSPLSRTDHCKVVLPLLRRKNVLRPLCLLDDLEIIRVVDATVKETT